MLVKIILTLQIKLGTINSLKLLSVQLLHNIYLFVYLDLI